MNNILKLFTLIFLYTTAALASPHTDLSKKLYEQLSNKSGNLLFSPYSIAQALSMTALGAGGNTEKEISMALGYSGNEIDFQEISNLRSNLMKLQQNSLRLQVANSIWPEKSFSLREDFSQRIQKYFDVTSYPQNYITQAEASRININNWISDNTGQKIKDLIQPGSLNSDTRLVLANAIYMKADWLDPFEAQNTRDADFYISKTDKKTVKMMSKTSSGEYFESELFQAVSLPYVNPKLSMVVLLPKENVDLSRIEKQFVLGNLGQQLLKFERRQVSVFLPKFKFDSGVINLNNALGNIGVRDAFSAGLADFSKISDAWLKDPQDRLYLSEVVHKAFIAIDEKGTEAAAATAVIMERMGAAIPIEKPITFRADRPFMFFIKALEDNTILFIGRVERV